MRSITRALPAALAVAFAAAAAPAGATTFCVPDFHAACGANGANVAVNELQAATGLQSYDGEADRVVVAAGTFTDHNGFRVEAGSDPLEIVGAGPSTRLTTTAQALGDRVVDATQNDRDLTLHDLTVVVPAEIPDDLGIGLLLRDDLVHDVDVEVRSQNAYGIADTDGSTIRDTRVRPAAGGTVGRAVHVRNDVPGTTVVEGVATTSSGAGISAEHGTYVVVRRSRIDALSGWTVVAEPGAGGIIANTLMTTRDDGVLAYATGDMSTSLALDHTTIVGQGAGAGTGLSAIVDGNSTGTGTAVLSVNNAIVTGFASTFHRTAPDAPGVGGATIKLAYSFYPPAHHQSGNGQVQIGSGTSDGVPSFAGPADFRLRPGSPGIDRGAPGSGGTARDLDGTARELDGDGDGIARADVGAYEYAPAPAPDAGPAPEPAGTASTTTSPAAQPVPPAPRGDRTAPAIRRLRIAKRLTARRGGAVELTLSEAATVTLVLARGGKHAPVTRTVKGKTGRNRIAFGRLPRGTYRLTARATDAAGNASRTARLKVRVTRR